MQTALFADVISAVRRHCLSTETAEDDSILAAACVRALAGGRNNAVFAADLEGEALCLKCYRVDERRRAEREWQILSALHQAECSVSPTPYCLDFDPAAPITVMERLPGQPLGSLNLGEPELSALAQALQELHSLTPGMLPSIVWPVDSNALARLGRVRAEIKRLLSLRQKDEHLIHGAAWLTGPEASLLERPADPVFSRGDPNLANCLWDGRRVRIVDYEYGGWTDRAFDLADLVEHTQSRATPEAEWLWFVSQFSLSPDEATRFAASRRLLSLFWLALFWPSIGTSAATLERFAVQRLRVARLFAE